LKKEIKSTLKLKALFSFETVTFIPVKLNVQIHYSSPVSHDPSETNLTVYARVN